MLFSLMGWGSERKMENWFGKEDDSLNTQEGGKINSCLPEWMEGIMQQDVPSQ